MWHNFDVITFHSVLHYNRNSSAHVGEWRRKHRMRDKNVPTPERILNWTFYEPFNNIYKSNKVIPIDLENLSEFLWIVITLGWDCVCMNNNIFTSKIDRYERKIKTKQKKPKQKATIHAPLSSCCSVLSLQNVPLFLCVLVTQWMVLP